MKRTTLVLLMALGAAQAVAQATPEGLWRNVDDKTGQAKAEIRIAANSGALAGRIDKVLVPSEDPLCSACTDDRKGQPKLGLEIIRGARQSGTEALWEGRILDPENGKEYTLRMAPLEAGRKLQVRGYIGPFYRTQVWTRVE